jgi:hypothetical protein
MRHVRTIFSLCSVAALLTACATALPVQEVRQVSAAYNAAAGAAAPLLDELAIAERRAELRAPPDEARAFSAGELTVFFNFDPRAAASLASIGDPARTAAQRRGLKVVGAYIDILESLAEGRNIEETKARIQTLASNVAALAAVATGGTAVVVAPFISALGPILDAAGKAANAEELRRLALEGAQPVDDLIGRLIASTKDIYTVLIDEPRRAATITFSQNKPAQYGELLKIKAVQVGLANYVVLLEQLRLTFAALVNVVRTPSAITLSSLTASTNEVLLQAESARRAYAILRHAPGANGVLEVTP